MRHITVLLLAASFPLAATDFSRAQIKAAPNSIAATVLAEELERRTGAKLNADPTRTITLATSPTMPSEGYAPEANSNAIRITARSERGLLYGVGALLTHGTWAPNQFEVAPTNLSSSPASPLRGHQLGYRSTANSWDAWTVAQYDQYIRELVLQGVNAIENIPFQDTRPSPHFKLERRQMNREISRICQKYGIEYWVWLPAEFDLTDALKRTDFLKQFDAMVAETPVLHGIFVPGGDPGHNPPELVMPLLEDLAKRTTAKVWLSLQGFNREREDYVYRWIKDKQPTWLGGLVVGPSSPPLARSREQLPRNYPIRLYPDITHNKICQYQVPHWDQAYALTLGREAINPRPFEMAAIHNRHVDSSIGFITYSDGVHDDVNKAVFNALGWNPNRDPRSIVIDYARLHFSATHGEEIADAILALERNWAGDLVGNGGVESTLRTWDNLNSKLPQLKTNWRWQMNQLRAVYDAFIRRRLIHERKLEQQANAILLGEDPSISDAIAVLNQWPLKDGLREAIIGLCEALFQSIGLQTSVEKYQASGAERGAVLDFIDAPLNNRFWLEDEFKKNPTKARLREIATWENPGPGSFYDDIGHEFKSPHTEMDDRDEPLFWWLDQGRSRLRLSEQTTMWPARLRYEGLDPKASYTVRTGGQGQHLLSIDGKPVKGNREFEVPAEALADGQLVLTFDVPKDEGHLNWRERSRLAEVWLIKKIPAL
jgi:hypothetical protein